MPWEKSATPSPWHAKPSYPVRDVLGKKRTLSLGDPIGSELSATRTVACDTTMTISELAVASIGPWGTALRDKHMFPAPNFSTLTHP
jgi:hypothetical protein